MSAGSDGRGPRIKTLFATLAATLLINLAGAWPSGTPVRQFESHADIGAPKLARLSGLQH